MQGETAQRILKTADTLMTERGYSAFSYADVAEAVEIRKASIHHHFPSKAGLVVAVLRERHGRMLEGTAAMKESIGNPLERIRAYVDHWEGCIRGQTMPFCVAALLAAELPSLPEEVQEEVRLHFTSLARWMGETLEEGVAQKVMRLRGPVETEAQVLMAAIHGAMLSARATGNCEVFRAVTDAALERISVIPRT